jgi:hypothetical protein
MRVEDDFRNGVGNGWHITTTEGGIVAAGAGGLVLNDALMPHRRYVNAQLADYTYDDFAFRWTPPLRMTVRARASAPAAGLRGTAGFGFWNHPASPDEGRIVPRLPRACWFFFGSPPNALPTPRGVPGHGWLAMTLDATRPRALALAPLALPAVLLMKLPPLYNALWPPITRALTLHTAALDGDLLGDLHTYSIDWHTDGVTFAVDGATVLQTPNAPRGKVGFVAWIDNQYAIATPQGRFGWGVVPLDGAQSLTLDYVHIEKF